MGNDPVVIHRGIPSTQRPRARAFAWLATAMFAAAAVLATTAACIGENDLTLDQRHRGLSEQLMCPVCDSQTIDQSSAAVAEDMKAVIWQQLEAGESNEDIRSYFVARYGEAVLASPRASGFNLTAWTFPALLAVVGLAVVGAAYLRMRLPARSPQPRARRRVGGGIGIGATAGAGAGAASGAVAANDRVPNGDSDGELAKYLALVDEEFRATRPSDTSDAQRSGSGQPRHTASDAGADAGADFSDAGARPADGARQQS